MHALLRPIGLIEAIDRRLEVLKIHLPYYEDEPEFVGGSSEILNTDLRPIPFSAM
jgi:hypothetical protein